MGESPEFWTHVLSNLLVLLFGTALVVLSYGAYRRFRRPSLRLAPIGFGLVTLGVLVELLYETLLNRSYVLAGRELLAVHAVEGVLVAAGLLVLLYSLARY